jgi:hypothetical protein
MLVPACTLPSTAAALPPAAIEDPVPVGEADVPPVPTVDADVPPTAAEPAVPPEMLVCAERGVDAARRIATAAPLMYAFMTENPF